MWSRPCNRCVQDSTSKRWSAGATTTGTWRTRAWSTCVTSSICHPKLCQPHWRPKPDRRRPRRRQEPEDHRVARNRPNRPEPNQSTVEKMVVSSEAVSVVAELRRWTTSRAILFKSTRLSVFGLFRCDQPIEMFIGDLSARFAPSLYRVNTF